MQISDFKVAVVTGGASGIGLAAATRFLAAGLKVVIADVAGERLRGAAADLEADAPGRILAVPTDVSRRDDLQRLDEATRAVFGPPDLLMNNAGIQPGSSVFDAANWTNVLTTESDGDRPWLSGHRCRDGAWWAARPHHQPGSKQGITTPPGDPAYNVAKAGVKAFTEALQHELRNMPGCRTSAHLLVPGFVYTPLTAKGRATKPDAAWTPTQTIDHMVERLAQNEFYILCPDNDADRAIDEKRILWAAGDIIESRPPLSRWHADYKAAFAAFAAKN